MPPKCNGCMYTERIEGRIYCCNEDSHVYTQDVTDETGCMKRCIGHVYVTTDGATSYFGTVSKISFT